MKKTNANPELDRRMPQTLCRSIPPLLRCAALAAVCALALAMAACGKPSPAPSAADSTDTALQTDIGGASSAAPDSAANTEAMLPQDTLDGANAITAITPPYEEKMRANYIPALLPPDLQELYNAAAFLGRQCMLGYSFPLDYTAEPLTMDNGMPYYPDTAFVQYSKFRAAMDAVFTTQLTDQLLNESMQFVDDGNDTLYVTDGARGANILLKDVTYALASVSDTEIALTMTAHYAKDMDNSGNLSEEEEMRDSALRLVKTDAGWRFSEFPLPY